MSKSEIPGRPTPTPKKVNRLKFPGHAELGFAGPCSQCGRSPGYDQALDEYDPDFIYPATRTGHSLALKHAVCSETWGGCGHVVVALSYQSCVDLWNNPTPDMAYTYLPGMEKLIADYVVASRKWWDEFQRTGDALHAPQPRDWSYNVDMFLQERLPRRGRK